MPDKKKKSKIDSGAEYARKVNESLHRDEIYGRALAKSKEGMKLTAEEQAEYDRQGKMMKEFKDRVAAKNRKVK